MLKVGITGGIGTGKTTCCKIFESLGIPIYYADKRAKELMIFDKPLKAAIKEEFGDGSYFKNGRLNRRHIAQIAFQDKQAIERLNNLVHPAVHADGELWFNMQVDTPYTMKEAALLVETGGYKKMDKLIVVISPMELRMKRVMTRDSLTPEEFQQRVANQLPEEDKISKADHIIYNDSEHSLIKQIQNIHTLLSNTNNTICLKSMSVPHKN